MAATISEYLVKAASYNNASQDFQKKIRTLGDQFSTLHGFKTASVESLEGIKNQEGFPLVKSLTDKEKEIVQIIQNDIDDSVSLEDNFIALLTARFIRKQTKMLSDMSLEDINTNPLLCSALKLETVSDLVRYNVYALATRSIVTSMGYLVQDLLLYSSSDVFDGKEYKEGKNTKWDIVVERLDAVRSYIEVKSGPNDLDAAQVKNYKAEIRAVEKKGHKGYIGITYGKRDANTVTMNLFRLYLDNWEERTLIGTELWDFVSENESYHEELMSMIKHTASLVLQKQSIVALIEQKIDVLIEAFDATYGSIDEYFAQLW